MRRAGLAEIIRDTACIVGGQRLQASSSVLVYRLRASAALILTGL